MLLLSSYIKLPFLKSISMYIEFSIYSNFRCSVRKESTFVDFRMYYSTWQNFSGTIWFCHELLIFDTFLVYHFCALNGIGLYQEFYGLGFCHTNGFLAFFEFLDFFSLFMLVIINSFKLKIELIVVFTIVSR